MKKTANYSLRTWVFTVTLAPTILVSLMLGGFYTLSLFSAFESTLEKEGTNIMTPLVIAAEQSLKNNQRESLKTLVDRMHRSHSPLINSIAIYNEYNQLFVTSNYHRMIGEFSDFDAKNIPNTLAIINDSQHIIITSPISIEITQTNDDLDQERIIGYVMMQLNAQHTLIEQHRVAIITFMIISLGIGLNLFFTFRLHNNVTRPIAAMGRAVAQIRDGKLDTRLNDSLIGELETLKRGINGIAVTVQENHEQSQRNIEIATSEMLESMEQIEMQNVELALANRKAHEGSKIKSEFLANMSHELRTPLNGLIGITQQLLKTQLSPGQLEYLQTIEKSSQSLFNIIKDILDFSQLEAGKMHLNSIEFSVRDTIEHVIDILATSAHDKDLDLHINISPTTIDSVIGDNQRFQQILTNLIGNAIKFTHKGHVALNVYSECIGQRKHKLLFDVIDTGIGIKREHQEKLFNAFEQADASIGRVYGGSGLGLAITKRIIEEMHGNITCASDPNAGSQFTCYITVEESDIKSPFHLNTILDKDLKLYSQSIQHASILIQQLKHWQLDVDYFNTAKGWRNSPDIERCDCAVIHYPGPYNDLSLLIDLLTPLAQSTNVIVLIDTNDLTVQQSIMALGVNYCHINPISCRKLFNSIERIQASNVSVVNSTNPPSTVVKFPNKRALLVDDNEINLMLISTILNDKIGEYVLAKDGVEAVDACSVQKFDIIFMDINMPRLDGLKATALIRKDGLNRHSPIVATTAHALEEEKHNWLNEGIDDFLTKPIDVLAVDNILAHWLEPSLVHDNVLQVLEYNSDKEFIHNENEHLSWQLALKQAMGKKDLAIELLTKFIATIPETILLLEAAMSEQNSEELYQQIHKLHGACCYTGVPRLTTLANAIETALKKQASIVEIEPELLEIIDELQLVSSIGTTLLNQESDNANE